MNSQSALKVFVNEMAFTRWPVGRYWRFKEVLCDDRCSLPNSIGYSHCLLRIQHRGHCSQTLL